VSERRVRLLYKTTCWTCEQPVPADTTIWWDDDRKHATCTECVPIDVRADQATTAPSSGDDRSRRRVEILRANQTRLASR
jgi:hypothetical protein